MNPVEVIRSRRDELGEGAIWDVANQRLLSVDIMRGHVHVFDPASRHERTIAVGQPVGTVVTCRDGGLMVAVRDGFARADSANGALTFVADVERDRPDQRMNDGACDAAGRFWAGTMALDERDGAGGLYRLDPDGSVHHMVHGVGISNGIDWSLDGSVMYYVDSLTQRIDRFDFDRETGSIANRRPFVEIATKDGCPDGLTVDGEGAVWLALWGGAALHRYTPEGTLDRVVPLPVTYPTTCAFGGTDLRDLYITSAMIKMSADARDRERAAGCLLRFRPGVKGRPAHAFGECAGSDVRE